MPQLIENFFFVLRMTMAPFRRGSRGRRGSFPRGRGSRFPRGTRKGPGHDQKNTTAFRSTRVEEPRVIDPGEGRSLDGTSDPEAEEPSDLDSSASDEDSPATTVRPYNALLQALNKSQSNGQPSAKRRKSSHSADPTLLAVESSVFKDPQASVHLDIDQLEEPEEVNDLITEAPNDDSDESDNGDLSMFSNST
jgi:hypothetical protein